MGRRNTGVTDYSALVEFIRAYRNARARVKNTVTTPRLNDHARDRRSDVGYLMISFLQDKLAQKYPGKTVEQLSITDLDKLVEALPTNVKGITFEEVEKKLEEICEGSLVWQEK